MPSFVAAREDNFNTEPERRRQSSLWLCVEVFFGCGQRLRCELNDAWFRNNRGLMIAD